MAVMIDVQGTEYGGQLCTLDKPRVGETSSSLLALVLTS